jgi:hypothetical protein
MNCTTVHLVIFELCLAWLERGKGQGSLCLVHARVALSCGMALSLLTAMMHRSSPCAGGYVALRPQEASTIIDNYIGMLTTWGVGKKQLAGQGLLYGLLLPPPLLQPCLMAPLAILLEVGCGALLHHCGEAPRTSFVDHDVGCLAASNKPCVDIL